MLVQTFPSVSNYSSCLGFQADVFFFSKGLFPGMYVIPKQQWHHLKERASPVLRDFPVNLAIGKIHRVTFFEILVGSCLV